MKFPLSNVAFLMLGLTLLLSCSRTQIYETKPTSQINISDQGYTFENDTVRITYNFWADKGQLLFHVFNKLNVPIYIDWKRTSFVQNSQKLDYWTDKTMSKGVTLYRANGSSGKSKTVETTTKMERVTFIAPKSNVDRNSFVLLIEGFSIPNSAPSEDLKIKDSPGKKAKYQSFELANSPLVFRNFITFSTTEQGENPFYVDNGFYVSKILETKSTNVFTHLGDDNPQNIKAKLYDPTWFYINR